MDINDMVDRVALVVGDCMHLQTAPNPTLDNCVYKECRCRAKAANAIEIVRGLTALPHGK